MRLKKIMLMLTVVVAAMALGGLSAHADDLSWALASAPQGITASEYFTTGGKPAASGYSNDASIITNPNTNTKSVVQVTKDATNQVGSIWSNDAYSFDLNKKQTASMWVYFSGYQSEATDGMALVLQNSSRSALTQMQSGQTSWYGETLGVWGSDVDNSDISKVTGTAIQNSWALEFDTRGNNQTLTTDNYTTLGVGFDALNSYPHIAWGYPASSSTYLQDSVEVPGLLGIKKTTHYAYQMQHRGTIMDGTTTMLANGKWHHITVSWDPTSSTLSYTWDDRVPIPRQTGSTTIPANAGQPQTGTTKSLTLDTSQFYQNSTQAYSQSSGKLIWGFTGSTGSDTENNLVIFDQMPGLVDATASATITDTTTGKTVGSGDAVTGNDHARIDYQATYNSGTANWTNLTANLTLPTNITYKKATVTYADSSLATKTYDLSGLTSQAASYALQSLDSDNDVAKISVTGTFDNPATTTATSVSAATSEFTGDEALVQATTNAFTIKHQTSDLVLSVDNSLPISTTTGSDVTVTGKVATADGDVPSSTVTIQPTLNADDLSNVTLQSDGTYSLTIPAAKLNEGKNTLILTASDDADDSAPAVTVPIVVGTLEFGTVSTDADFTTTALTGSSQNIATDGDWALNVKDTRGTGSKWALYARVSSPFVSSGTQLSGNLVYEDASGNEQTIGDSNTLIESHETTSSDSATTTDVAGSWSSSKGLLMHINGNNTAGTYSGEITWTLQDAPS